MLYFDHNSTTPVDPSVAAVADQANREFFGNPSSIHSGGQIARRQLEQARREIARSLGAHESEIVLTSGGTESNNLALRGVLSAGMHAITTSIEHPSVLEPFRQLEREGVDVTYLPVTADGVVRPDDLEKAINGRTALVSVMSANNETGALQPVKEIAEILRGRRIVFHSDGVQAAGKLDVNLAPSGIDLFSISSHKLYAPKGSGALYVRKGTALKSLILGGRHERGRRAGTENVAAALALACALSLCSAAERETIAQLRDDFETQILNAIPDARINAAATSRLPNTSNIRFPGVPGEALLIALDMAGLCVSTGAACSSGSVEPSHVLLEMGLTPKQARSCIRFSFGRGNTRAQIDQLAAAVSAYVHRMREKQLV